MFWHKNLDLLYEKVGKRKFYDQYISIDKEREWIGFVVMPKGLVEYHARKNHLVIARAWLVGGWPLVFAFSDPEEYLLAKLIF